MAKGFSPRAHKLVTIYAQDEGRRNGSEQLEPEHMVLALLKTGDGLAYAALQLLKINTLSMQVALERTLQVKSVSMLSSELPPSRRLRTLLDNAAIESRTLSNEYIGTEHLLLAAFRESESATAAFFDKIGVSLEMLRDAVIKVSTTHTSSAYDIHKRGSFSSADDGATGKDAMPPNQNGGPRVAGTGMPRFTQNGGQSNGMGGVGINGTGNVGGGFSERQSYGMQNERSMGGMSGGSAGSGARMFSSLTGSKQNAQTSLLKEYSRDLTARAREGAMDPVIGRDKEIARVIQILSRRSKNNPVLVGEPGVGKTAIVEGLARRIAAEEVPRNLLNKRVLTLDLASVIAGTKFRGEFEERIKRIMKEIAENKNIILFIDELHTIIGAGGAEGAMDASNMMKPALSRGELQCIGATTNKEYRKYFEKDAALERRFQLVQVEETSEADTKAILNGLKPKYEEFHGVRYDDEVIDTVVRYSNRFITERFLPDKAIDVLDEAGAMKKIASDTRPPELTELENRISVLNEEKQQLVANQNYERAAEVRDEVRILRQKLASVKRYWQTTDANGSNLVTVDDVKQVLSVMTGIPLENLDTAQSARLINMEAELHKTVIGQDEAVSLIASAVRRARAGVSSFNRPLGSFIFLGPTGVGKTLLAKTLARFLFGTDDALVRIDMSDFMEKHNSSRLVGAPPGYVGYEEGGVLTEKIRTNPYSVVLLDEIEKAHSDVFNLLLQMLEEGELKDNLGHTVNFRNTVIIMTSNAGVRQISNENRLGFATSKDGIMDYQSIKSSAMNELKRILSPELLNRVDDIVVFNALNRDEVASILKIQLDELASRLAEKNLSLTVKADAKAYLIDNGYDPQFGARPMRRLIQREIEDALSLKILACDGELCGKVIVDYKNDKIRVNLKKSPAAPKAKNRADMNSSVEGTAQSEDASEKTPPVSDESLPVSVE